MYVYVCALDSLELKLETLVICHVNARKRTPAFWKKRQYS